MSRRSDREGVAPEGICLPETPRGNAAACLAEAAAFRRQLHWYGGDLHAKAASLTRAWLEKAREFRTGAA